MNNLPINEVLPYIKQTLQEHNKLILQAPPGSGKSTVVPICFLNEPYMKNKKIIVLQPRRVATRMVASRLAFNLNQKIGDDIGYIIKNENIQSKNTKVLVVTEAILTRMLQDDQDLCDVGMIIFDEFHERSIHTDLSLALSLQVQELLRADLKIILMSATINSKDSLKLLGNDTKVINSNGAMYDVQDIYLKKDILLNKNNIYHITLNTILNSLKNDNGDILVFVSGIKYINYLENELKNKINNGNTIVLPLHSKLTKQQQDKAINKNSKRKVILSTNIAQTSLTIDGVKIVIDTGYEKESFYDHNTAMNKLHEQFISIDSSIQRKGRAGRTSNGKCYKIWHQGKILEQSNKPEILRSDLQSLLLDLALWGECSFDDLKFIDIPKDEFVNQNKKMLMQLDMIDEFSNITNYGKKAIKLGLHPRYAFMILSANKLGFANEACILASILSSNIIINDLKSYFIQIQNKNTQNYKDKDVLNSAFKYYDKLKSITNINTPSKKFSINLLGVLLLFAYPDRLAKQRKQNSELYKLSNGKGAMLKKDDILFNKQYLVVSSLNALNTNSIINTALSIELDFIKTYFKNSIKTKKDISYDKKTNSLNIKEIYYILNLELYSKNININEIENKKEIYLNLLQKEYLELLDFNEKVIQLQNRVAFLNENSKNKIQDISNEYIKNNIKEIFTLYINNISNIKELKKIDLYTILYSSLNYEEQTILEQHCPKYIQVPSGSNIKIDYENKQIAILKVRLQEIFTLMQTPKILNNTKALQIHILSPAYNQIAITYDLKSFWDNSYTDVKKDLMGKYKRHYWPNDPYEAVATRKTKRFM